MEFVLFACWGLYFLPFAVSAGNEHEHPIGILIFNTLTGWTGVGWVVTLVWALHPSPHHALPGGAAPVVRLHRATTA